MQHEVILNTCLPILGSARRHSSGSRGFLTAYQIWFILLDENLEFCNQLRSECGDAVGSGGGCPDGPARRIADALGHSSDSVETLYFDPKKVFFGRDRTEIVEASGQVCGLFRLIN